MVDLDGKIKRAEGERKDAIEHGDRKGRWYAEGKIDALKQCRIQANLESGNQSDREIAIGEHAFRAGYYAARGDMSAYQGEDRFVQAWSAYTPPDDLCGGGK